MDMRPSKARKFLTYLASPARLNDSLPPGVLLPADEDVAAMEFEEARSVLHQIHLEHAEVQSLLNFLSSASIPVIIARGPTTDLGGLLYDYSLSVLAFLISEGRVVLK